nr:MAG TPA: hypothetical protein [Caudoviricetes sp.]
MNSLSLTSTLLYLSIFALIAFSSVENMISLSNSALFLSKLAIN